MHSTSLIGQALGGATGTKASAASDTSKAASPKERPFADYMEGASSKADAASAPAQDQANSKSAKEGATVSEGDVRQQRESADAENGQTPDAEFAAADGLGTDETPRQSRTNSKLIAETQSDSAQAAAASSTQVVTEDGDEAAMGKDGRAEAGKSQSPDAQLGASGRDGQVQSGGTIGKETLASQAPERIGAGDKKVAQPEASTIPKGDAPAEEPAVPQRPEAAARAGAALTEAQAQAQARAASTRKQANSAQAASSADAAAAKDVESLRAGEKTAESRASDVNSAAARTPHTPTQSVFQMQVQNSEAGDLRKSRYRIREGDLQPKGDAPKAAPVGAATNAAAMTSSSAIAMVQSVQPITAKFSQNPSLAADSVAGQASLTADLPGLPQLLTEAVFQPGATHRVETPRMIATQLAEAFAAKGERNMDVSLNPEELGRVKMRVSTSETGIVMTIQTERPETGDLMRRHINELAEEFRRMGFQDISFEFSSGDSSGGQAEQGLGGDGGGPLGGTVEMAASDTAADTQKQNLQLGSTGVDMRV